MRVHHVIATYVVGLVIVFFMAATVDQATLAGVYRAFVLQQQGRLP